MSARYYYHVRHGNTVNAAVRVNGFTVHHGSSDSQDGIIGPIDHFLMPGDNQLEVEIRIADPDHGGAYFHASIVANDGDQRLVALDWPADYPALPEPLPPFPTLQIRPFLVPGDHPEAVFVKAPVEHVPPDGTDETWAIVKKLHGAFERGDKAPIHELFASRAAELHRFYNLADTTPAGAAQMIESMMTGPYDMLPLYGGLVLFRECAGGRAVQLLRVDGNPSIAGRLKGNPKVRFLFNPVLVREGGAYRIVG